MSEESNRSKQEPKLYIQQPESLSIPEASMQRKYHQALSHQQESAVERTIPKRQKRTLNFSDLQAHSLEEEATEEQKTNDAHEEEISSEVEQESGGKLKGRKRFNDMSLEEKVFYFVHLPKQVPKMKCQVKTNDGKTYRGLITNYEDGLVEMKVYQRPYQVNLPFETIKEIRLLGF